MGSVFDVAKQGYEKYHGEFPAHNIPRKILVVVVVVLCVLTGFFFLLQWRQSELRFCSQDGTVSIRDPRLEPDFWPFKRPPTPSSVCLV